MIDKIAQFSLWLKSQINKWNEIGIVKFILSILGLISLTAFLKLYLHVGDEVISGVSAALITLMGVQLTIKNSQFTLDKQLKHQEKTFSEQIISQEKSKAKERIIELKKELYYEINELTAKTETDIAQYFSTLNKDSSNKINIERYYPLLARCKIISTEEIKDKFSAYINYTFKIWMLMVNDSIGLQTLLTEKKHRLIVMKEFEKRLKSLTIKINTLNENLTDPAARKYQSSLLADELQSTMNESEKISLKINQIDEQMRIERTALAEKFNKQISVIAALSDNLNKEFRADLGFIEISELSNKEH